MNYYAKAIEVCSEEQNWKQIVIEIAKKHPKIVVNAADVGSWKIEARELYLAQDKKVSAIKHCRNMTGMGLKEAKEAVEALTLL